MTTPAAPGPTGPASPEPTGPASSSTGATATGSTSPASGSTRPNAPGLGGTNAPDSTVPAASGSAVAAARGSSGAAASGLAGPENATAAQASGGLAGARPPDPDGGPGKRTYAPDFLTELFRNPLDPGYADAAARKARDGEATGVRRLTRGSAAVLTLIALGFLLVVAYQQTVADAPAATQARTALIDQVQKRRGETEALQKQADQLGSDVSALREKELGGAAVAQLKDLESATGLAPVRGNGAKVTLGDGPTPVNPLTGERNTVGQVKDTDLQLATNALWSLGAEAIAINGQRLTATSTIRQAGEAILVDFRPVSTPYEVVAIGPDNLSQNFRDGYAGKFFKELVSKYGMSFDASNVRDVTLDAATELKLRVAEPSTPPPSPSGSAKASAAPGSTRKAAQPHVSSSEGGR
jgi:uncharacterized protein YlxW (UPF0749 family)